MGKETEANKMINEALRSVQGMRTGGEPVKDPAHDQFNSWIRQELARTQGVEDTFFSRDGG